MSLFGLLGTMGGALAAQQAALDVTGQNVSNVNTPGYVRQSAVLETTQVSSANDGGVNVASVQRAFNTFTYGQVLTQHGLKGSADARSQALTAAQGAVAPQGGGSIGDSLNQFFSTVQTLTSSPSAPAARSALLAQATQLAQAVSTTSQGLSQQQSGLLDQAKGVATTVNDALKQIAVLNGKIAEANGNGDLAPDLRDQRDALASTVADNVGARVLQDASGTVTLFAAGSVLVSGDKASSLSVGTDANGAMQVTVSRPGGSPIDVTKSVTDGTLGGLREARDVDIAQTQTALDQLAYDFSNAVNAVHSQGYGLDGVSGRNLFTAPTQVKGAAAGMAVDPSVAGNPSRVAASLSAGGLPGGNDAVLGLAALASQPLASGGTPSAQFGTLAAGLGNAASNASTDAATRADTVTQAENLNSSASGVSLTEESVNLTKFQQAFQAATHVLQVADSMIGDFMTAMSTA